MQARRLALAALIIATTALAGCGGGSSSTSGGGDGAGGASTPPAGETANDKGKEVFATNCAGCHTLEAAGSRGNVGPELTNIKASAATVAAQVKKGGNGMPSFSGTLSAEEITAVSEYVAENDGS